MMFYTKYKCHPIGKSMLNLAQKFAQCEMGSKMSKSGQVFKVKNRNQIFLNSKYLLRTPL